MDDYFDAHAIRETIAEHRAKKALQYRNNRVEKAIWEAQDKNDRINVPMIRVRTESQIDQAEETRKRNIEDSKTRWKISLIAWNGPCNGINSGAELQAAADMEETGVDWILTNRYSYMFSCSYAGLF